MTSSPAIYAHKLGKCYQIYKQPADRLKQALWRGKKQFFKEFWALKNASFSLQKGETLGIIGSNGSGKSTLLQLICGILTPTTGDLSIDGRVAALLELGAGFNPEFSGRENVMMNAAIMGLSQNEIKACYDDIVNFAKIGHFIDRPVKTYSSGMYVRLAFATAINVSPDILVVDEALSVGDIRFQQKCMAKIKAFCENGTVIFVSHDSTAVMELCSRVIWVESGRIRMDGAPKPVIEKYLQYMYEGDSSDKQLPKNSAKSYKNKSKSGCQNTEFTPIPKDSQQFGTGSVIIEKVRMHSQNKNGAVYSAKPCEISLILSVRQHVARPIIGFLIKDRLGREIIGDNTFLIQKDFFSLLKGKNYCLTFQIDQWPNLCEGDYTLSLAVADGTMEEHVQCHWVHDAIAFKSIPARTPNAILSILNTNVQLSQV